MHFKFTIVSSSASAKSAECLPKRTREEAGIMTIIFLTWRAPRVLFSPWRFVLAMRSPLGGYCKEDTPLRVWFLVCVSGLTWFWFYMCACVSVYMYKNVYVQLFLSLCVFFSTRVVSVSAHPSAKALYARRFVIRTGVQCCFVFYTKLGPHYFSSVVFL